MRHWFLAGTDHFFSKQYAASARSLRTALGLAEARQDKPAVAWIHRWIAVLEKIRGARADELESLCSGLSQALQRADDSCEPPETIVGAASPRAAVFLTNQIGLSYHSKEQLDRAGEWYAAVMDMLASEYPWRHQFAVTSSNFGGLQYQRGNYAQARELFQRAYDIHVGSGSLENQRNMLSNLALVDAKTGNLNRAIDYYASAIELAEQLDLPISRGKTLVRLGTLYKNIGRLPLAEQLAQEALEAFAAASEAQGSLDARLLLSDTLLAAGQLVQARIAYGSGLRQAVDLQDIGGQIQAKTQLAVVSLAEGQLVEAARLSAQARTLATAHGMQVGLPEIVILQARIDEQAGRPEAADAGFVAAREMSTDNPGQFIDASTGLARLRGPGDPSAALRILEEAREKLELWRRDVADPFVEAEIVQRTSAVNEVEIAIYLSLFEQSRNDQDLFAALRISDSGQGQILDRLRRYGVQSNREVEALQREVAELVSESISAEGRKDLDQELQRLQKKLEFAQTRASSQQEPSPQAWHAPTLSPSEAVLSFQVAERSSTGWLMTADNTIRFDLPARGELEPLVQRVIAGFRSRQGETEDLKALSDALLAQVSDLQGISVLYVVPDEFLHAVPFSALLQPGVRGAIAKGAQGRLTTQHQLAQPRPGRRRSHAVGTGGGQPTVFGAFSARRFFRAGAPALDSNRAQCHHRTLPLTKYACAGSRARHTSGPSRIAACQLLAYSHRGPRDCG